MIYFYPRPPRGGRHGGTNPPPATYRFLSTPSARRATADDVAPGAGLIEISIHALREEGDTMSCGTSTSWPRFLSTPSARRATSGVCAVPVNLLFLSTPSARRATLVQPSAQPRVHISIHALREEGDFQLVRGFNSQHKFLSTPSARRATAHRNRSTRCSARFLSTPSARRATQVIAVNLRTALFLSTPSARRATSPFFLVRTVGIISIHALREEGDGSGHSHL